MVRHCQPKPIGHYFLDCFPPPLFTSFSASKGETSVGFGKPTEVSPEISANYISAHAIYAKIRSARFLPESGKRAKDTRNENHRKITG